MRKVVMMLFVAGAVTVAGGEVRAQGKVTRMAAKPAQEQGNKAVAVWTTEDGRKLKVEQQLRDLQMTADKIAFASSGMLGAVVTGAPYSAVTVSESVQALPDGNRIVQKSTTEVSRDSQGRVRRVERNAAGEVQSIVILDPVANVSYVLDPGTRTARKISLMIEKRARADANKVALFATEAQARAADEIKQKVAVASAAPAGQVRITAAPSVKRMEGREESLGTQLIEGVAAEGSRKIGTIPAGQIGNERPIEIVSEQWYSHELQITISSRHSDPRSGETNYRVTNLNRSEPDAALFQVPADYTISASANTFSIRSIRK